MARQAGWRIVLRVEDLDTPRVKPGVIGLTVDLLAWLGMDWDEGPLIQSDEPAPARAAMGRLVADGRVFRCERTRKEVEAAAAAMSAPQEGSHELVYPLALRPERGAGAWRAPFDDDAASWRFAAEADEVRFEDAFARGADATRVHRVDVSRSTGDFIVWTRRDAAQPGQPAYQLAVVVDDARQGVTRVIRGDDLLDSTARQITLARALGHERLPEYTHLPLVLGPDGKRLAKRHGDTRLDVYRASGVSPERVIGLVAYWSGVSSTRVPMSAGEFRGSFDLHRLSADAVRFSAEDESWLRNGQ